MQIQWIAHSCFKITLESGTVLLFDPFGEGIGYTMPQVEADMCFAAMIILITMV